jgi:hypothetical protein
MANISSEQARAAASKQRRRWNAGYSAAAKHRRAKAIARGDVEGLFQPFSKRPTDDVRNLIDEAIAAGHVTKVARGVSGIDYGV